jgi:uncharacterized protein YdeI (BOF family)
MKLKIVLYLMVVLVAFASCSKDDEAKKKGSDEDVTHTGDKWNITSVEYTLIDQSTSGQTFKNGTKSNVGAFYFDGGNGSFEFELEGYHKEDSFQFSDEQGNITVAAIEQGVGGGEVSQNVFVLSGTKTSDTAMTLEGSIIKQSSLTSQFTLTATFTLEKL